MRKTTFPAVLATFVVCFLFWVLLTWSFTVQELAAGAVVSLAVALFSARFCYWIFLFPVELVKANVDMARRCFTGCTDINPGIVKVPVGLKSDYGQAALANSITLTPGTITMDVAEQEGQTYYYIHWIDVTASGEEAGEAIKGRLEKGLKGVWE